MKGLHKKTDILILTFFGLVPLVASLWQVKKTNNPTPAPLPTNTKQKAFFEESGPTHGALKVILPSVIYLLQQVMNPSTMLQGCFTVISRLIYIYSMA